jgi:hypothetical protein
LTKGVVFYVCSHFVSSKEDYAMTMAAINELVSDIDGSNARVYGKPRDANPHPESSGAARSLARRLDALQGGGTHIRSGEAEEPSALNYFFVIPIIDDGGRANFGDCRELPTSQDAFREGGMIARDKQHPGVVVVGAATVQEDDVNFSQPIAVFGNGADFTLTFRRLCAAAVEESADAGVRDLFASPGACDSWAAR